MLACLSKHFLKRLLIDVNTSSYPAQGFIRAIVGPLFELVARIPESNMGHCLETLHSNTARWDEVAQAVDNENDAAVAEIKGRPTEPFNVRSS
jgi:hypothetical protein